MGSDQTTHRGRRTDGFTVLDICYMSCYRREASSYFYDDPLFLWDLSSI